MSIVQLTSSQRRGLRIQLHLASVPPGRSDAAGSLLRSAVGRRGCWRRQGSRCLGTVVDVWRDSGGVDAKRANVVIRRGLAGAGHAAQGKG